MLQLAIEIASDTVRAAVKDGLGINTIVPLGLLDNPYYCPAICLCTKDSGYIFGQAAKLNAAARPNEIVFLSDYIKKGGVDSGVIVALINYVCSRVESTFHDCVDTITFVTPPHVGNVQVQRFLSECVSMSGYNANIGPDVTLAFVRTNLNVARGENVCVIDTRLYPSTID